MTSATPKGGGGEWSETSTSKIAHCAHGAKRCEACNRRESYYSNWYYYFMVIIKLCLHLSWCILPGSKAEKPAPNGGNPKPPKNVPPILLWSARPWWRRLLPKNGSSPNGSTPNNRSVKFSDLDNLRASQMIDWSKRIAYPQYPIVLKCFISMSLLFPSCYNLSVSTFNFLIFRALE